MSELLPCPFCGCSTPQISTPETGSVTIVCIGEREGEGCGASCSWQPNVKAAREAWNRRFVNPC